jgi:type II secretory pathway component PulF
MVKHLEKAYFQMASLLEAGLPIVRSLKVVAENQKGRLRKAFAFLEDRVSSGSQLNEAMAEKRRVFAPVDVTMVAAAEESGNLPDTFKMLADWYELRIKLRRKLIGGLAFPVFILHLAVFIANLTPMFLGTITPAQYVRICFTMLGLLWGIFFAIRLLIALTPKRGLIRLPFDTFVLFIPLLRKPLYNMALARFCRSFYMLYSAGIPITRASELAVNLTGNLVVTRLVAGAARKAQAGDDMSGGFNKHYLPVEFYSLWETGEESGTLDKMSLHLAKMYEDLASHGFDVLVFWLPRLFYLLLLLYMALLVVRGFGMIFQRTFNFD